jgi:protocatechuate 3,4-dioxygenase alpha subunit
MSLQQTTAQTFGPYFHIGLRPIAIAIPAGAPKIVIRGRVTDGDGKPVGDAAIETWQADPAGKYPSQPPEGSALGASNLGALGRVPTDADGRFEIVTFKPGRVAAPDGAPAPALQAPHLLVCIGLRGLLKHLVTRMYFPGDAGNGEDVVLNLVQPDRRATLIARAAAPGELQWDIVLQGPNETVFFDC